MDGFQYKNGDRPLEGYTIQRAIGRGGFGEVYYAVSDSGREVALKAVQGYEDIELRGVSQCMNLKSPHLVTIFDVKRNAEDRPFVIMEYVAGPSLRELLTESPSGLGTQKAAFFLREIAKGLTFLHDRGIVHRDLKPGNIFYEDGYVKIGDYGLSKVIAASRHTAQTVTVGTVHYMAPEIGQGQYDRGIDIYALGIVLYEMLTGQVPFFGSSHGEILMKHLTASPDLTGIEEPFATVIKRALAKDPTQRFRSVQEMVEAVFGEEHIQQSVSHFRPESLSMIAQRVAQKVAVGGPGSSAEHAQGLGPAHQAAQAGSSDVWQDLSKQMDEFGRKMGEWGRKVGEQVGQAGTRIGGRVAGQPASQPAVQPAATPAPAAAPDLLDSSLDPLTHGQRRRLWLVTIAVMAVGTSLIETSAHNGDPIITAMVAGALILGSSLGIFRASHMLSARLQHEKGLVRYLAFGGAAFIGAGIVAFFGLWSRTGHTAVRDTYLPLLGSVFFIDWLGRVVPTRSQRVSLEQTVTAGIVGFIFSLFTDGSMVLLTGILAGTSMAVQVASPFVPPSLRGGGQPRTGTGQKAPVGGAGPGEPPQMRNRAAASPPTVGTRRVQPAYAPPEWYAADRIVPAWVRAICLGLFVLLLGSGVTLLIMLGVAHNDDEVITFGSGGIFCLLLSLLALVRSVRMQFVSWWSSLIKPLLMIACTEAAVTSAFILGAAHDSDTEITCIGVMVFSAILFVVTACIPNRAIRSLFGVVAAPAPPSKPASGVSPRGRLWAMLLALVFFATGLGGLHRMYVGKVGTGILWLLTCGGFGIGQIVDIIMIAAGQFTDKEGRRLLLWTNPNEYAPAGGFPATVPPNHVVNGPPLRTDGHHHDLAPSTTGRQGAVAVQGNEGPLPPPASPASPQLRAETGFRHITSPPSTNPILAAMAFALLFAAAMTGLLAAIDAPMAVMAGLPDPSLATEISRLLGSASWTSLVERLLTAASAILGLLGAAMLLVARRRAGAGHSGRAALGTIAFFLTLIALHHAFVSVNWFPIGSLIRDHHAGPAIEEFLNRIDSGSAAMAGLMFLATVALFFWPAKRREDVVSTLAGGAA
jgi:TM2 domain-containing membrane protein YozV